MAAEAVQMDQKVQIQSLTPIHPRAVDTADKMRRLADLAAAAAETETIAEQLLRLEIHPALPLLRVITVACLTVIEAAVVAVALVPLVQVLQVIRVPPEGPEVRRQLLGQA